MKVAFFNVMKDLSWTSAFIELLSLQSSVMPPFCFTLQVLCIGSLKLFS